jgi:uncharacterized protein with PIN domain
MLRTRVQAPNGVVDTSAIVAIPLDEEYAEPLVEILSTTTDMRCQRRRARPR